MITVFPIVTKYVLVRSFLRPVILILRPTKLENTFWFEPKIAEVITAFVLVNLVVTSPWFSSERNLNFEFLNLRNVEVSLQTCPNAARFSASGSASESILYCYGTGVGLCDLSNTSSQFVVTQPGSYFVSARLATPNCNGQTLSVNSTTPYVVSSQFLNSSTDFTLRGSVSLSLYFSSPSCGINQLRISTGS